MGSFEDHVRYGVGFYTCAVLLTFVPLAYFLADGTLDSVAVAFGVGAAVVGFPFALAGASFPDIDHHSAKPHRFFKRWVAVASGVAAGYVLFASGVAVEAGYVAVETVEAAPDAPEPVLGGSVAFFGAVAFGSVAFAAIGVLKPRHRGVTHTLGAGFVVACIVGVCVWYAVSVFVPSLGVPAGGVAGASFFVGFLSHLQCDGLLLRILPDAMG
ncbi:MAG: metal-dependent hydrolase [Halobacteriales archaeon]|nr:metal-dependent hydrolase [Halobacteriales archaeon]